MKKTLAVLLSCSMIFGLSACGSSGTASTTAAVDTGSTEAAAESTAKEGIDTENLPELTIDFGYALAEETPTGYGAKKFAEVMNELSGGKCTVNLYPSSQIGSEREMQEGCSMGTVDMCIGSTATLVNFDKKWMIYDMPFVVSGYEQAYKSQDSEFGKKMLESLNDINIKGLGFIDCGFTEMLNNAHELKVPTDLSGLNMRCMESTGYIATLSGFGANPVQSATSEVYNMVQNGTVDGTCNPVATFYSFSMYEVAKYMSRMYTWNTPVVMVMSKDLWESLDPAYQEMVLTASEEAVKYSREIRETMEEDWLKQMEDAGLIVTTYTDEERQQWVDYAKEKVYPKVIPSEIPQDLWDEFIASVE